MGKDVIVACDFPSRSLTLDFLNLFSTQKPFVKIGMELFYAEGPSIVKEIKARGHRIFLDLKLHDIPNTVKSAMAVLSALDIDMCNLHAGGTIPMMEAAIEGLTRPNGARPLLIAVTQLTSTSEEPNAQRSPDSGIHAGNRHALRKMCAFGRTRRRRLFPAGGRSRPCSLRPYVFNRYAGVRFSNDSRGDQVRVTTPAKAKELGSDFIVVGRPITAASDPVAAYVRCKNEFLS